MNEPWNKELEVPVNLDIGRAEVIGRNGRFAIQSIRFTANGPFAGITGRSLAKGEIINGGFNLPLVSLDEVALKWCRMRGFLSDQPNQEGADWVFAKNIDLDMLHEQKLALIEMLNEKGIPEGEDILWGLVHMLDEMGDDADERGDWVNPHAE